MTVKIIVGINVNPSKWHHQCAFLNQIRCLSNDLHVVFELCPSSARNKLTLVQKEVLRGMERPNVMRCILRSLIGVVTINYDWVNKCVEIDVEYKHSSSSPRSSHLA